MRRTLTTAFATLGMVISSALCAVLVAGLAEGIHRIPDVVSTIAPIVVFVGGAGLAGRVAVDVGRDKAIAGVLTAAALVLVGGVAAASITESAGEGLETSTVVELGVGLASLLVVSVAVNRRSTPSEEAGS